MRRKERRRCIISLSQKCFVLRHGSKTALGPYRAGQHEKGTLPIRGVAFDDLFGRDFAHESFSQAYQKSSGYLPPAISTLKRVLTTSAAPQQYCDLGPRSRSGCKWLSGRRRFS